MEGYKILVVDDELTNLEIIVDLLEESDESYDLLRAIDGETAFHIALAEMPDLIITDWEMPSVNGIELIQRLKNEPRTQEIPIIMCTGAMLDSKSLKYALEVGAYDFIRKPIDKTELAARVQSMLRLGDSYKKIKSLNVFKDKIFSIISHDLKPSIGNIKNITEISEFRQKVTDPSLLKMLELIGDAAGSSFMLLENLLSWAKSQQGTILYRPEIGNVIHLVDECIEVYSLNAQKKGLQIETVVNDNFPVLFDEALLSIVFRNLLSNAIKFSNPGGTIAIIVAHNEYEGEACLEISFTDYGVGMTDKNIAKILSPNEHFTTYGTEKEKGSGLGLKLCKEIIEVHGSTLNITSKPNEGSTFSFFLKI